MEWELKGTTYKIQCDAQRISVQHCAENCKKKRGLETNNCILPYQNHTTGQHPTFSHVLHEYTKFFHGNKTPP